MRRTTYTWDVATLRKQFSQINFPEYQREPNIWSRVAKQRLIDSMLRHFDVASFYFYRDEKSDTLDCIDGRQRLGAIMSFLGDNDEDTDNHFEFRVLNEIYEDDEYAYAALHDNSFSELRRRASDGDSLATDLVRRFLEYEITVVELSGSQRSREFNLQFTRLNLGTIINSGEKLHAMVGDLRNVCFRDLGNHPFLASAAIPTRRYSREQLAAQIVAQVFSCETARTGGSEPSWGARTRHFDLQRLFKEHAHLDESRQEALERLRVLMGSLELGFREFTPLRNRAIIVSTVLLAYTHGVRGEGDARRLAEFTEEFVGRLTWQTKIKGLDIDSYYRYLAEFQRHVTQASVEKRAVEARASTLASEYSRWLSDQTILGDQEYRLEYGSDPSHDWRAALGRPVRHG